MADTLSSLSAAIAERVAAAAPLVASLDSGGRGSLSAILWRDGVLVTSEQSLRDAERYEATLPGGTKVAATLAGRDATTNVAVLRLEAGAPGITHAEPHAVGSLVLALGADGQGGSTARMGGIEVLGPAWQSMKGGRIDRLLRIGVRLPSGAEGGPVIDPEGGVLGMSTFGPRREVMVIPSATIERAVGPLLTQGRMTRGWLGVGLHEVALPRDIATRAGAERGLMVMGLADDAPATGKLLPGDIVIAIEGTKVSSSRAVAGMLGPETVGKSLNISLVRAGELATASLIVAARPA